MWGVGESPSTVVVALGEAGLDEIAVQRCSEPAAR